MGLGFPATFQSQAGGHPRVSPAAGSIGRSPRKQPGPVGHESFLQATPGAGRPGRAKSTGQKHQLPCPPCPPGEGSPGGKSLQVGWGGRESIFLISELQAAPLFLQIRIGGSRNP